MQETSTTASIFEKPPVETEPGDEPESGWVQSHVSDNESSNHPQLTPLDSLGESAQSAPAPPSIWPLGPCPTKAELFTATADLGKRTEKLITDTGPTVRETQAWLARQEVDHLRIGIGVSKLQIFTQYAASHIKALSSQIENTQGALPPTQDTLALMNDS